MIGASLRRVASGNTFASLGEGDWIKSSTTIFAGATNDKTIVRSDELVSKMRTDPLFLDRTWPTAALDSTGAPYVLHGCMALCDGGYHNWLETMSGINNATNAIEVRWTDRYTASRLLPYALG